MTEVKVFYNVPDKLAFACRLAKRAVDEGKRLIVYAPDPAVADTFDRLLWSFQQLSFVPHVRAGHVLAGETPIVIADTDIGLHHHEALLNLADDPPPFFSRFELLREVVSQEESDRECARERARFYKARGFAISHQDMGQGA